MSYDQLPSFSKESYNSAISISNKMRTYPLVRANFNWKLASYYLNLKTTWLEDCLLYLGPDAQKNKLTFMAKIEVYNPNSISTVFQIVVAPKRMLPSLDNRAVKLSYNSCVREYAMGLPRIETISMLHCLSVLPTVLDLFDGFKSPTDCFILLKTLL